MPWKNRSGRTAPLPPGWRTIRLQQLDRDDHQCTHIREDTGRRCTERATDVHHYGNADEHDKLTSLCAFHHDKITGRQGATSPRRVKEARPAEKHPGLAS